MVLPGGDLTSLGKAAAQSRPRHLSNRWDVLIEGVLIELMEQTLLENTPKRVRLTIRKNPPSNTAEVKSNSLNLITRLTFYPKLF